MNCLPSTYCFMLKLDDPYRDRNRQLNNLEYKLQLCLDRYSSSAELQSNAQRDDGHQSNKKIGSAIRKTGLWLKYRLIPLTFPPPWQIHRTGSLHLPHMPVLLLACSGNTILDTISTIKVGFELQYQAWRFANGQIHYVRLKSTVNYSMYLENNHRISHSHNLTLLRLSEGMEHCRDIMNVTFHDTKGGESSTPRRISVSKEYDTSKQRKKIHFFYLNPSQSSLYSAGL
jgi:hypothetical protein